MQITKPKQNIPNHAKLVFEGQKMGIYQWEQEMFDGSVAIFEGLKYHSYTNVIAITKQGKFLLQREEQPNLGKFINIAGGGMDQGEEPLASAKRELLEESGCISNNWHFLFSQSTWNKSDAVGYYFVARNVQKIQEPQLDIGEKVEVFEVSWQEFVDIVCSDEFRDIGLKMLVLKAYKNGTLEELKKQILGE